jgi:hypothetical protein
MYKGFEPFTAKAQRPRGRREFIVFVSVTWRLSDSAVN